MWFISLNRAQLHRLVQYIDVLAHAYGFLANFMQLKKIILWLENFLDKTVAEGHECGADISQAIRNAPPAVLYVHIAPFKLHLYSKSTNGTKW